MGLREKFMVKQTLVDEDLELEAKVGESLLVKDIIIANPAAHPVDADYYLGVNIDKDMVGFFRVGGNLGSHLPLALGNLSHSHALEHNNTDIGGSPVIAGITNALGTNIVTIGINELDGAATEHANVVKYGSIPVPQTLLALLGKLGHFKGYPIGEGQKLTLSRVKQADCLQMLIYEIHDAGDIKPTDQNGSDTKEYLFINYGRVAAAITTSVSTIFSVVKSVPQFPDFPFGKDVPAKTEIDILGILFSDVVDDRGSDDTMNTDYLKLIRGRETMFDEDKNGVLVKGLIGTIDGEAQFARGYSLIGNYSSIDGKLPMLFDPPLTFTPGEELGIYITTTAGDSQANSDLAVADLEIGLIERVRLLE